MESALSLEREFDVVIGLETHVQMSTNTKLFCGCKVEFASPPNTNVCPVCLAHPGSLPVMNRQAVEYAVKAAIALNCKVHNLSIMARKNYFYPDLPKGYQISQYDRPLATDGWVKIKTQDGYKKVRIHRLHIEEDAGKTVHEGSCSYVDLNRAGTPLMEIVTEPDISSPEEARQYLEKLRLIMRYIGVSDADMEKGQLRCDVNISLKPKGTSQLGTKVELKNINSFRFIVKAIEYEIERQSKLLMKGEKIIQETRLFDPNTGKTYTMRTKEEAHDYRYFPDPDLLLVLIKEERIEEIKKELPELPDQKVEKYITNLGLPEYDATVLVSDRDLALFFEESLKFYPEAPKQTANWILNELLGKLNDRGIEINRSPVKPSQLAQLVRLIQEGTISGKIGKEVFDQMFETSKDPVDIVEEKGLKQIVDEGQIRQIVKVVLERHPAEVQKYREGNSKLLGFLVGQIMKETKGKANPAMVNKILQEELG